VKLLRVEVENAAVRRRLALLEDVAKAVIAAGKRVVDNIAAIKRELQH
jgi:hypothetical protein